MTPKEREVFFLTFITIFILCFLITFFTPPTYEAVAVVPLAEPLATEKRIRMPEDEWLWAVRQRLPVGGATEPMGVSLQGVPGLPQAKIAVEGESPYYCAALANAVAEQIQEGEHLKKRYLAPIEGATVPKHPIRPKRLQNIIFGAILAVVIGIKISLIAGLIERSKRRKTDLKQTG